MRKSYKVAAAGAAVAAIAVAGGSAATAGGTASGANTRNAVAAPSSIRPALAVPRAFAVLNADGSFVRGRAVVSVLHLSTGTYDVRFQGSIARCAWTGTTGFGQFSGSLPNGSGISVTGRAGTNNGLFVQTSVGPNSVDLPFTVLVVCS